MSIRLERINSEIQRTLADIFRYKSEEIIGKAMVSVLKADTTKDLFHCKVYISVFGCPDKAEVFAAIVKSTSFYRRELSHAMSNLRVTPELAFILDESLDYSRKIDNILDKIKK